MAKNMQQNNPIITTTTTETNESRSGAGGKKRIKTRQMSGTGSTSGGRLSRNSSSTSLSSTSNMNPPSTSLDYALLLNDASRNSFDSTQSSFLVNFFFVTRFHPYANLFNMCLLLFPNIKIRFHILDHIERKS